jgi:hypothetical protein
MCTFYQTLYYNSGWVMEDALGGACRACYGKRKNPYKILVGKFEDSLPLVKHRRRCVANIKVERRRCVANIKVEKRRCVANIKVERRRCVANIKVERRRCVANIKVEKRSCVANNNDEWRR